MRLWPLSYKGGPVHSSSTCTPATQTPACQDLPDGHRLDGEDVAGPHGADGLVVPVVRDRRGLVELAPDPVPREGCHDGTFVPASTTRKKVIGG